MSTDAMTARSAKRRRTPKLLKRIFQSEPFRRFLYAAIVGYLRLLRSSTRWSIVREEIPHRFWDEDKPFIAAFWHGRNLVTPLCWRTHRTVNMLASQHRDGDITENVLKRLGLKTLRGSSGDPKKGKMAKGGATALRNMARIIQSGESIAITPDGPRGPRQRAGEGVAAIARLTGVPVVPVCVSIRRARILKSWDRLMIPLPFSRGVIAWGEPIHIAREGGPEELERGRRAVEDGMNRLLREADELIGRTPIEPAPIEAPQPALAAM